MRYIQHPRPTSFLSPNSPHIPHLQHLGRMPYSLTKSVNKWLGLLDINHVTLRREPSVRTTWDYVVRMDWPVEFISAIPLVRFLQFPHVLSCWSCTFLSVEFQWGIAWNPNATSCWTCHEGRVITSDFTKLTELADDGNILILMNCQSLMIQKC